MSDEALNKHLDWLDECAEEQAQVVEIEQGYLDWLERIADDTVPLLLDALERHTKMFEMVCDKVDFGSAFLDAKTIAEWNDASIQQPKLSNKQRRGEDEYILGFGSRCLCDSRTI